MKRVMVWDWIPEEYTPRYICGPDLLMRDSLHARFGTLQQGLFDGVMQRADCPVDSSVVCPRMNAGQRLKFLELHCHRYCYKIKYPERYLSLVQSIEGVEFAICLARAGEVPRRGVVDGGINPLDWEFRLRNNFPQALASALLGGGIAGQWGC